ncbi:MAG TPA: N-acetyl-gamma-glutamyl-phosphate reductase [Bacteroidota bacterium]
MLNIAIVGASGYSGAELLQILLRHRSANVTQLFARSAAGTSVLETFPRFRKLMNARFEAYSPESLKDADLVFLALPSGEAMEVVPEIVERGMRVIDLSGDFRLADHKVYERYYARPHSAPELLAQSVYGLPEFNRSAIAGAHLVANPGCYPTGILIPLVPLLRDGIVEPEGISINSISGTSGAGRKNSQELSFSEVNENVRAYKVGVHQHIPEIFGGLQRFAGCAADVAFVPHLAPLTRGIHTTIIARMKQSISEPQLHDLFHSWFVNEPFVRLLDGRPPEVKDVAGTNFCDIGFKLDASSNRLYLFSAIDNLIKGAAGQAVQNMNILFGIEETEGLL